jgi:putative N-acetylmannosamine-6-phosphate epimerase
MPSIIRNLRGTMMGFVAAAVFVVAMNCAASPRAATSTSDLVARSVPASQAVMVDRSRKGDRLDAAATGKAAIPVGCDRPFSPLAKLSPSDSIGRCLT